MNSYLLTAAIFLGILIFFPPSRRSIERDRKKREHLDAQHLSGTDFCE